MSSPWMTVVFILFLSPLISALSLPSPLYIGNQTIPHNTTFDSGFGVCSSHTTSPSSLPKFSDCQEAVNRRLPYYPGKATFHIGGPDDAFKLPLFDLWGSCVIKVVIGGRDVTQEESSWLEIRNAANELNEVCRVGDFTGGKIMTGANDKIWIALSMVEFEDALANS